MVHAAEGEEQVRFLVQAGADAIQDGGDVFAHGRPVRTAALEADLGRSGKHAGFRITDALHDALRETPLEQFDQRIDGAGAVLAYRGPPVLWERRHLHADSVDGRAAHESGDRAGSDLQIDHRAVADVGAAARQAVRVVAIAFEVVTPRLAPERRGNGSPIAHDRLPRVYVLPHLGP